MTYRLIQQPSSKIFLLRMLQENYLLKQTKNNLLMTQKLIFLKTVKFG